MNKLTLYILVIAGLSIFFYVMGLSPSNQLIQVMLNPADIGNSPIWVQIHLAITLAAGAAMTYGLFSGKNIVYAARGTFITLIMFPYLICIVDVVSMIYSVIPILGILVCSPLLLLFLVTLFEAWSQ